jgi:hypothetical protein
MIDQRNEIERNYVEITYEKGPPVGADQLAAADALVAARSVKEDTTRRRKGGL